MLGVLPQTPPGAGNSISSGSPGLCGEPLGVGKDHGIKVFASFFKKKSFLVLF
jgi:hypothetical protein